MCVQANPLKTTVGGLSVRLEGEGGAVSAHPWLPNCLVLSGSGNMERLTAHKDGLFLVQDPASRLVVLAAGPKPGDTVIDGCAAPGGKSFSAAMLMENRGSILSCDVHPAKLSRMESDAGRLGISIIKTTLLDGTIPAEEHQNSADLILADVPCSGMGIIRKKPDIRYRNKALLAGLPPLQGSLLHNLSSYVKPGGVLLYSTCTVRREENEDVVRAFLKEHTEFRPEAFRLPGPAGDSPEGMLTLWPHIHGTDGFFICRLRKNI